MITIGDKVLCRLYNKMDRKSYGPTFVGQVEDIEKSGYSVKTWRYLVLSNDRIQGIWLSRKEIKRKVK